MTDKEKAEEHALLYCVRNCTGNECATRKTCERYKARYNSFLSGLDEGKSESKKEIAELKGKIKGIEAGKLKWHDLRKNPKDLPKENGKYIIHIKVTERMSITDTCDFFDGYFGRYINPVAWCELPIFKE